MREAVLERFLKKHKIEIECCDVCHEDISSEMCELYFTKKRYANVCCGVSSAWNKLIKIFPKYKALEEY
jgi:hypothetical protein